MSKIHADQVSEFAFANYSCSADVVTKASSASRCTNIPDNVQGWYVQELEDSQKSQSAADRSEQ